MRINRVMASAVASVLALGAVAPAFADNDHRRDHDRREWREDRGNILLVAIATGVIAQYVLSSR